MTQMSTLCVCGHQYGWHSPNLHLCIGDTYCNCRRFESCTTQQEGAA